MAGFIAGAVGHLLIEASSSYVELDACFKKEKYKSCQTIVLQFHVRVCNLLPLLLSAKTYLPQDRAPALYTSCKQAVRNLFLDNLFY